MVKTTEFNVQTQMNYIVGNMSGFTTAYTGMDNLSALISSLMTSYTTLAGTGRAAYMALGASVAAFGLKSAEAFGEYERGMNIVKAISNNTNAQMQVLSQTANQFSTQFRMDISELNDGLVTLGRAGLTNVNNQIQVLQNGLKVAKLEGMNLAATLEDIVTTTSLLGGDVTKNDFGADSSKVSNLLVATSLAGPLDVGDVIETLKFAGGSAAAAGANLNNEEGLKDLLGTIGAFSQKGVIGSIAGTALRAFITKPASQDKTVKDALAELGLDAYSLWEKDDENGWQMRPIAEQIGMITKAMDKQHMTNLDRIEVWGDIVGNKMGQQMLKLDENKIKDVTKQIDHQRNLDEIYQGTLTNFASQVERLNQVLQSIYRNIGSGFANSLTGIVEGAATILDWINNFGNGLIPKLIAPILGPLGLYGLAKGLQDFLHVLQALRENIAISANTPLEDQDIWQTSNGVVAKRYKQRWIEEERRKRAEESSSNKPSPLRKLFDGDTKRGSDFEKSYKENQDYYAMKRKRDEENYKENQAYYAMKRDRDEADYRKNQAYYEQKRAQDQEYHALRMSKMLNLDKITVGSRFAEVFAESVVVNGNVAPNGNENVVATKLTDDMKAAAESQRKAAVEREEIKEKIDPNLKFLEKSVAPAIPALNDKMLFNKKDFRYGIRFKDQDDFDDFYKSEAGQEAMSILGVLESGMKVGTFVGGAMNNAKNIEDFITENGILDDSGRELHQKAKEYVDIVGQSLGFSGETLQLFEETFQNAYRSMQKNFEETGAYDRYFTEKDGATHIISQATDSNGRVYDPRNRMLADLTRQSLHNFLGTELSGALKDTISEAVWLDIDKDDWFNEDFWKDLDGTINETFASIPLDENKRFKGTTLELLSYLMTTSPYESLVRTTAFKNSKVSGEIGGPEAAERTRTAITSSMHNRGFMDHLDIGSQTESISVAGAGFLKTFAENGGFGNYAGKLEFNQISLAFDQELQRIEELLNSRKEFVKPKVAEYASGILTTFKNTMGIHSPGFMFYATEGELQLIEELFVQMRGEIGNVSGALGTEVAEKYQQAAMNKGLAADQVNYIRKNLYRQAAMDKGLATDQADHIIENFESGFTDWNRIEKVQAVDRKKSGNLTSSELEKMAALPYWTIDPQRGVTKKYEGRTELPSDLVGFDTETTGVVTFFKNLADVVKNDRMLEWGTAKKVNDEIEEQSGLSNADGMKSTREAQLVHGITEEQRSKAPEAEEAWKNFVNATGESKNLVAYNGKFEANLIENAIKRGVLDKKFAEGLKIYDPMLLFKDFIEKTNKLKIIPGLGTNGFNSLGLKIGGKQLLDNTLDTVNRFFGRGSELHKAASDAKDGLNAFIDLFGKQQGLGSRLKNVQEILWSNQTGKELNKEEDWTENDELRKRGRQIRDLSELEVLALTNRNQMRSILASNNEEFGELTSIKREQMITKELVERAIQLNSSANLGFNERIIKSFGKGKNVSLSGTQQSTLDLLTKLQMLNNKNRFTRSDLVDFLKATPEQKRLDTNKEIERELSRDLSSSRNRSRGAKKAILPGISNTSDTPFTPTSFESTIYGAEKMTKIQAVESFLNDIYHGGLLDETTRKNVLSNVWSLAYGNHPAITTDLRDRISSLIWGDKAKEQSSKILSSMLGITDVFSGSGIKDRAKGRVNSRSEEAEIEAVMADFNEEIDNYLAEQTMKPWISSRSRSGNNLISKQELMLRALFSQVGDKILPSSDKIVQTFIDTQKDMSNWDNLVKKDSSKDKNMYLSPYESPLSTFDTDPSFQSYGTASAEIVNGNPFRHVSPSELIAELNKTMPEFAFAMKEGMLEVSNGFINETREGLLNRIQNMEKTFKQNTHDLNAFWNTSDVSNPIRNFKTIEDLGPYMLAVQEYDRRFGKEHGKYKIPEEFTNKTQIANAISALPPNELQRELANAGALKVDYETKQGREKIYNRLNSLLSKVVQGFEATIFSTSPKGVTIGDHVREPWVERAWAYNIEDDWDDKTQEERFAKFQGGMSTQYFLETQQQRYKDHVGIYDKGSRRYNRAMANYQPEYIDKLDTMLTRVGLAIDDLVVAVDGKRVPLAKSFELLGSTSIDAFRAGLQMNSPPRAFTELLNYLSSTEDSTIRSVERLGELLNKLRSNLRGMPEGTKFDITGYQAKQMNDMIQDPNHYVYGSDKIYRRKISDVLSLAKSKSNITQMPLYNRYNLPSQEILDKSIKATQESIDRSIRGKKLREQVEMKKAAEKIQYSPTSPKDAFSTLSTASLMGQIETAMKMKSFGQAINEAGVTFKAGSEEWIIQLAKSAGVQAEELMTHEEFVRRLQELMLQLSEGKIGYNEFATKSSELTSEQENREALVRKQEAIDRRIRRQQEGGLSGIGWRANYKLADIGGKIGKGVTGLMSGVFSLMMHPAVMMAQMVWGYIQQGIEMIKEWEQEKIAKLSEILSNATSAFDEQQSTWQNEQAEADESFGELSDNEKQDRMLKAMEDARNDSNNASAQTRALLGKQNAMIQASNNLIDQKSDQFLTGFDGVQARYTEFMEGSGMYGTKDEYGFMDFLEGIINPAKFEDNSNTRRLEALAESAIQIDTRVKNMEEFTEDYQQVMASMGIANRSILDIYNVRGIINENLLSGTFFDRSSRFGIGADGTMAAEKLAALMKTEEKILRRFENRYLRFMRTSTGQGDRITVTLGEGSIHSLANQLGVKDLEAAQMLAVHQLQRIQDVMINQVAPQLSQQAISLYEGSYQLSAQTQYDDVQTAFQNTMTQGIWMIQAQVAQLVYKATMEKALEDYQAETGDTETDTVGLLLNRARDTDYEFHDKAKLYASRGWGSFLEDRDINKLVNEGYTRDQAIQKLATERGVSADKLTEAYAKENFDELGKYQYSGAQRWLENHAGQILMLGGAAVGGVVGGIAIPGAGILPGAAAGGALGTAIGAGIGIGAGAGAGALAGAAYQGITDGLTDWSDPFTEHTNQMMQSYAANIPIDETIQTLNDAQIAENEEGDGGNKNKDDDDSSKQRYVQLAICNKKAIPKLNVNLFKKAPSFTVLNKNFKLRDIKINTADKAKNIENSLKNAIIEVQERSDPKIIQDSEGEYDPVGATDGDNLPTGASQTK